jgi:hypothetical protein
VMRFHGFEPELYRPLPDATPIDTTELDWRHQAREDGWTLLDGHWQHPDRDVVYDDTEWVYLGNGYWEDADVITWTPEQRRDLLARYQQLVHDTVDVIQHTDQLPPATGTGHVGQQ